MQRLASFVLMLALAVLAGAGIVSAQSAPAPPGNAKHGYAVFVNEGCYECHGYQGEGSGRRGNGTSIVGPNLAPKPIPWAAFIAQVRKPRRIMPSYEPAILSDRDTADIYAYLRSIPAGKPAADIPLLKGYIAPGAAK